MSGSNDYLTTPVTINSITVVPSQTDVVLVTAPSPLRRFPGPPITSKAIQRSIWLPSLPSIFPKVRLPS